MPPIIEARGLTKSFGKTRALDGLDLSIEAGQVVALLGPNGAGKTTFVRTVATLVRPHAGYVKVGGFDVAREGPEVRALIGLAGQHAAVEQAMTGKENLTMIARLYGQSGKDARANTAKVLAQLGLTDVGDRLVRTYSGGMRRKLDLGASLVGSPRLLLLDEPTTGLDPRSRIELWDAIRALANDGTDVLLTTQYLDEADHVAGRIIIVDHGRVIADGTAAELKSQAGHDVIEIHARDAASTDAAARALKRLEAGDPAIDVATHRASLRVEDGVHQLARALRALNEEGALIDDIALRRPTLDEVFLSLTGEPTTIAA
jgi:ABC-2 type transport system ATP-binding protein